MLNLPSSPSWGLLAGEFQHQRIDLQLDPLDLVGGELVLVAQLDRGVDRGMHDDAAGERLVGIERGLVALAETVGDFVVILLVLIVLAQPRLASIIASELVKFFDASNAAKMPLLAARPGLKLLFIEPKDSRKPTGCEAARPSAQTICCSFRPSSLPAAAAAPNTPAVPVMCQPTS